jgi:hypothetical protein
MTLTRVLTQSLILACALLLFTGTGSSADSGTVGVAREGINPFLLWDATPLVADLVRKKIGPTAALTELESKAMEIILAHAPTLKGARKFTIRVFYRKIGAVNPAYGTVMFAGTERVFEMSADARNVRSNGKFLSQSLAAGRIPAGVQVNVSGHLPPM